MGGLTFDSGERQMIWCEGDTIRAVVVVTVVMAVMVMMVMILVSSLLSFSPLDPRWSITSPCTCRRIRRVRSPSSTGCCPRRRRRRRRRRRQSRGRRRRRRRRRRSISPMSTPIRARARAVCRVCEAYTAPTGRRRAETSTSTGTAAPTRPSTRRTGLAVKDDDDNEEKKED